MSDDNNSYQKWTNFITLGVSAFMFVYSVILVLANQEDDRLNVLNPTSDGRESSSLSATFFAVIPLLAAKTLYHIHRQLQLQDHPAIPGDDGEEAINLKGARHFITLAILLALSSSYGLINQDAPEYCLTHKLADKVILNGTAGDVPHPHLHFDRCNVSDLKVTDKNNKIDKYGEATVSSVLILLIGAAALRLLGSLLDANELMGVSEWTDPSRIRGFKYFMLVGASVTTLVAFVISYEEDLKETYKKANVDTRILKDDELDGVYIATLILTIVHTVLLAFGALVKLNTDRCLQGLKVSTLNNIPAVRILVVTTVLTLLGYLVGLSSAHSVDYSFLSVAIVGEVVLDLLGREKTDETA